MPGPPDRLFHTRAIQKLIPNFNFADAFMQVPKSRNDFDVYDVLGVPKNADKGEIKRAYYRLAKLYHPDNGEKKSDPNASKMFSQATQAYDILSDDEKRRLFDQHGWAAIAEDFRQEAQDDYQKKVGWGAFHEDDPLSSVSLGAGESVELDVNLTFEEAFRGTTIEKIISRDVSCKDCSGQGTRSAFVKPQPCPSCRGRGVLQMGVGAVQVPRKCSPCAGTGSVIDDPCPSCRGNGTVRSSGPVKIPIPGGVYSGVHVRVPHAGNAGKRGAPSGHLWVHVFVRPHPVFHQSKADVHLDVPISLSKAATGGTIQVPIPPGEIVDVKIPAGVQPAETRVLRGKGAPVLGGKPGQRGDLFLKFSVRVPNIVDPTLQMALENLEISTPPRDKTWTNYLTSLTETSKADAKTK